MTSRLKYYTASLTFLSGIILALAGVTFAVSVNLTRSSDPSQINFTYGIVAFGLAVSLTGLSLMVKQRSTYTNYIIPLGFALSAAGVGKFVLSYPQGWIYPNITYIILLYAGGITILVANSFANAVLNLIEGKPVSIKEEIHYSDEEIEREVDRAIEESSRRLVEFSDSILGFRDVDMRGFIPGKAYGDKRETTRVKDSVDEAAILQSVESGRVKVEDTDLEEVSTLLKDTSLSESNDKRESNKYRRLIQKFSQ